MYGLNLDKETFRILSVGKLGDSVSLHGGVNIETLPNIKNFYDYCYINGEFVYSPIEKVSNVSTQSEQSERTMAVSNSKTVEERVDVLESKIDQLTELVNKLAAN